MGRIAFAAVASSGALIVAAAPVFAGPVLPTPTPPPVVVVTVPPVRLPALPPISLPPIRLPTPKTSPAPARPAAPPIKPPSPAGPVTAAPRAVNQRGVPPTVRRSLLPTTVPITDGVTPDVAAPQLALRSARALSLPLGVSGAVVMFLLVQGRIDRRDPKLIDAPVGADDDLLEFA